MRYCHKTNKNHVIDAIQILDNPDIYRLPDKELLQDMGVIVETGGIYRYHPKHASCCTTGQLSVIC